MDTEDLSGLSTSEGEASDDKSGRGSYPSNSPNGLSFDIEQRYSDELDFNESESDDQASHTHLMRSKDDISSEEREASSNEEGEIKEDTPTDKRTGKRYKKLGSPPTRSRVRAPTSKPPPDSPQSKSNRTCRHFLQGRCAWGDQCRFSHETEGSEDDFLRIRRSKSPISSQQHYPHYPSRNMDEFHPRFRSSQGPLRLRFPFEPKRLRPLHYLPPPEMGIPPYLPYARPYLPPYPWRLTPISDIVGSVEKVEEDQRWHRLRTIPSGWGGHSDDDDDDDGHSKTKSDLQVKLKQSRKNIKSSGSEESETEKKLKKKKRKKEKKKKKHKTSPVSSEEWVDPWVRSNSNNTRPGITKRDQSSEEESSAKRKKSKHKTSTNNPEEREEQGNKTMTRLPKVARAE